MDEIKKDKYGREIIDRKRLDALLAEFPTCIIISPQVNGKDYEVTQIPAAVKYSAVGVRKSNSYSPVSGVDKIFIYQGEEVGELDELMETLSTGPSTEEIVKEEKKAAKKAVPKKAKKK